MHLNGVRRDHKEDYVITVNYFTVIHFYFGADLILVSSVQALFTEIKSLPKFQLRFGGCRCLFKIVGSLLLTEIFSVPKQRIFSLPKIVRYWNKSGLQYIGLRYIDSRPVQHLRGTIDDMSFPEPAQFFFQSLPCESNEISPNHPKDTSFLYQDFDHFATALCFHIS